MDQDVINLAKAIRQKESNGNFDAVGDNGTSRGAYQWQAATWKGHAKQILGDENAQMTRDNQQAVAYGMMKTWKDQGLNPAQIAAKWNSGSEKGWENKVGTTTINGKPITYNVPQYVKDVTDTYHKFKLETQPAVQPEVGTQQPEQNKEPGFLASIGNAIVDPFIALGGGVANIIRPMIGQETSGEKIPSLFGGEGVNPIGYRDGKELGALDTAGQLAGNVAMAGANFIGGGAVKSAGQGVLAKTLPMATQLAKEGALAGAAYSGGQALSEGQSAGDVALETLKGGAIGGVAAPIIGVPIGLIPLATRSGRQAVTKQLETKYITQASDDWARVGSDYVKSGGVLTKEGKFGKDSTKFLGELGYSPKDFVVDGKFQTNDIADELSSSAIKDFDNTLTDMLSEAQFGKATVDLASLESKAINGVGSIARTTEGQKQSIIKNIKSEFTALRKKYPNGITLPDLNVQKGNYWSNTRFDATKPFQSDVNYVIGSTMKNAIQDTVKDAPVQELNALLGNYYAAAKFLRSINNRVPKMTVGQKIGSTFTKAAGTAVGGSIGGVPGGVSGFLFGKSLAGIIDNASNPVKGYVLRNLEKTNPEAYKQAIQYIGEQMANRMKKVTFVNPALQEKATQEISNAVKKVVK